MILSSGPSIEFIKYLQVLSLIFLCIGLPAVLVTVFLHYKRKKTNRIKGTVAEEALLQSSPELLGYTKGDGEYVFFDHSSLIKEFKRKLFYHRARYSSLRREFEKLEVKYAEIHSVRSRDHATIELLQQQLGNEKSVSASLRDDLAAKSEELERFTSAAFTMASHGRETGRTETRLNGENQRMAVH
jgi:hypothetical protein